MTKKKVIDNTQVVDVSAKGYLFKDLAENEKKRIRDAAIHERTKIVAKKDDNKLPLVTVGLLVYNQERTIEECLKSIARQEGDFSCRIIILDDCSKDNSKQKILECLKKISQSEHLQIEYIRNKKNLGMEKNFLKLLRLIKKSGCDFFTICEGDDYYFSADRIESHVRLYDNHPEVAMSFNKLLLYWQDENRYEVNDPNYNDDVLSTELLASDNKIGSLCASFYRIDVLNYLDEKMFDEMFVGDWMFNIVNSQYGIIKHINRPMSVYRKHSDGVWSGTNDVKKNRMLCREIGNYNRYLRFLYDGEFEIAREKSKEYLDSVNEYEDYDVVIIDNVSPHPLSGFSYQEFTSILSQIKNSVAYVTGEYLPALGNDSLENLIIAYKRKHEELSDKVLKLTEESKFNSRVLYGIFLNTAYNRLLHWSEKLQAPFVFTLYPGGGFQLDDENSDKKLREVFNSPWFRKVIVTQQVTYDYLIENDFCNREDIEMIFGVVTDVSKINREKTRDKYYGVNKNTLDICFVAHKYTECGRDKGYDLFIETAKVLSRQHENIAFHVVGPWDENIIDISGINNITFYGSKPPDWFTNFYMDKDLILSPNIDNELSNGAFDGFPTTSVTDAALNGVAMFCTDTLNLNGRRFEEGEEIVIVKHQVEDIVKKINYYYDNPKELRKLSELGMEKTKEIYSEKNQITPRIKIIKEVARAEKMQKKDGAEELSVAKKVKKKLRSAVSAVAPNVIKKVYKKARRIMLIMKEA